MCCYYRENSSSDLAQSCAKGPPRSLTSLCSPQGQRHQQQDICHTQMKDEGVGHTPSLPAPEQNSQQQPVAQDTHDKGHRVQNWDENGFELHALIQVAYVSLTFTAILVSRVIIRVIVCIIQAFKVFFGKYKSVGHQ